MSDALPYSTPAEIPGLIVLRPRVFRDSRGFFSETYNAQQLSQAGISATFIQDNHALSVDDNVVRGLHFQTPPHAQDKLVRVSRGAILDVAVDIRHDSPTFGHHFAIELSVENWTQLWIPKGFAHGYVTRRPNTEVIYKVTEFYAPEADKGLAWNDAALGIDWGVTSTEAILSDKDRSHPCLAELPAFFHYPVG